MAASLIVLIAIGNSAAVDFVAQNCVACHNAEKAKAKFRVDDLDPTVSEPGDFERWEKVLELVSIGDMPPEDEPQPSKSERREFVDWLTNELAKSGRGPGEARNDHPKFGNRVDHEELFSGEHEGPSFSAPRLWRKNPAIYNQMARDVRMERQGSGLSNPFTEVGGDGFQDYASLYADEATIKTLLLNARQVATTLLKGPANRDGERKLSSAMLRMFPPAELAGKEAEFVNATYELLLHRSPDEEELARQLTRLEETIELGGAEDGVHSWVMSVLMSPEFLFRMELGLGQQLPDGRRMLSGEELSYAIAFAINDAGPDEELRAAVEEGRLATKEDVAREVRRLLEAPDEEKFWTYPQTHRWTEIKPHRPPLLRFFREFFDYKKAEDVFKDEARNSKHKPLYLVRDADLLVLHALKEDEWVFETLMTTDRYFAAYMNPEQAKKFLAREPKRKSEYLELTKERGLTPIPGTYVKEYISAYNLKKETWSWPFEQPFQVPNRAGMLTHPAWLVAHSGHFETDPVRRGKWIQERLLAGNIPDIPIGVDARLEDDPHKTIEEKFEKTKAEECWRCHKKMNPLGMPFEAFDDFGRFREVFYFDEEEKLVDEDNRFPKRLADGEEFTTRQIDSSAAFELIEEIAKSDRARQSFIRHAFRFWMGRNETLNDSPTLIAADEAYLDSNGSFNALLISLLTSDSFLYRKGER
ncbi:MAG: DUF1588 domain-containing protein [Verrucomicrobiota bacterium]